MPFTSDFTRGGVVSNVVRTGNLQDGEHSITIRNALLSITDIRVHDGGNNVEDIACYYGTMATLTSNQRLRGVVYQIAKTDTNMYYDDPTKPHFHEREHYLEAWLVYSKKPSALDYIVNERYDPQTQ